MNGSIVAESSESAKMPKSSLITRKQSLNPTKILIGTQNTSLELISYTKQATKVFLIGTKNGFFSSLVFQTLSFANSLLVILPPVAFSLFVASNKGVRAHSSALLFEVATCL